MHDCRTANQELKAAKSQLQAQIKGMVQAEKELTDNLKLTHHQIEEQLQTLREQLKVSNVAFYVLLTVILSDS